MKRRDYRPGTDGDPERIAAGNAPVFFTYDPLPWPRHGGRGSRCEPAHRQKVHVYTACGQKLLAAYDRRERTFWAWIAGEWLDIGPEAVETWSQLPPEIREGFSPEEWDRKQP